MKMKHICGAAIVLAAILVPFHAHADLTTTSKMTLDLAKVTVMGQPLSADMIDEVMKSPMFADGLDVTTYQSGHKVKVVSPISATIIDQDTKTSVTLLPTTKQYMTSPLGIDVNKQLATTTESNVVDMHASKTILGHQASEYSFTVKNETMTVNGVAWITHDIAQPAVAGDTNPMIDIVKAKLSGVPLSMSGNIVMAMFGQIGFTYNVTSLSTAAIPASAFVIPQGYTKTDMPPMSSLPGL